MRCNIKCQGTEFRLSDSRGELDNDTYTQNYHKATEHTTNSDA